MEFLYPNLVRHQREYEWFMPNVGVKNCTHVFTPVSFGRKLAAGDALRVSFVLVFDHLDLSDRAAQFYLQGELQGTSNGWSGSALFGEDNYWRGGGQVLDGEKRVTTGCTVKAGDLVEGATGQKFGVRIDLAGGGRVTVRDVMVELNAPGAPHAWAPAEGEVWP